MQDHATAVILVFCRYSQLILSQEVAPVWCLDKLGSVPYRIFRDPHFPEHGQ
jgi:hypothetical protein